MIQYPLVSILIPLYNAEKYIAQTIESALSQTYINTEILIFDDGSTDKSLNIAKQYEYEYENVKVFTHENSGAQITRNKLFKLSKGQYIQYLDADDLLHEDKIRSQIVVLKDENVRVVSFGKWATFSNSDLESVKFKKLTVYQTYDDSIQFLIDLWTNLEAISPHAWLVPRKLIEESDKWNPSLTKNQDGDFFARIVAKANKVLFCEESKVYYRLDSENSVSKNFSNKATMSVLDSIDSYTTVLEPYLESADSKYALARIYSHFLFSIYPENKQVITLVKSRLKSLGYDRPVPIKDLKIVHILYKVFGPYLMMRVLKLMKHALNFLRQRKVGA